MGRPGKALGAGGLTLEGRHVPAGVVSRKFVARLLGIDRPAGRYAVRAVAWADHALEASVTVDGGEEVVFRIERRTEDSKGMILTDFLNLYFRGENIPEDLCRTVEAAAGKLLAGLTIESLSERIAADPELGNPDLPMPPGVDERGRPRSLLDTWGDRDAYADFFAGGELSRAQLDSLAPETLFLFVQHSDCECLHVNPHTGGPVVWLVNYPWDNRIRHGYGAGDQKDLTALLVGEMITTDLNESDVIMGNPDKLARVLEYAEKAHRATGKTLFFSNTCTPVVIGEDVESQVRRWQKETGCPLLFLTVTPRSMVNVFHDVLVSRRLAAEEKSSKPRDRTVNLVGFRSDQETGELIELLGLLDIEVNCVVLPDLSFELIDMLPRGALNVFFPNQLWQHLYDQLQFSSNIPFVRPAAPFGIQGTRRWLEEVAGFFGVTSVHREALQGRLQEYGQQFEEAVSNNSGIRLGLVFRGDETYYATRPASTWGVPVIEVLEEMGFSLDVFIKVEDREGARRSAQEVHGIFKDPSRHIVKAFDSMDLMRRRLRESECRAVLSSHFFDWRVTESGKNLFSLQCFEMGLRGAVATTRRLTGVCRTPFYRMYHAYLRRTPEGLWEAATGSPTRT